ncbi:uncharacterized protein [Ptychodera flava]|uniref:uncharacterized protein isoform X2 n=1 Tax=Ptychodera flava TaxID=63121 RepID=UPI00396A96AA
MQSTAVTPSPKGSKSEEGASSKVLNSQGTCRAGADILRMIGVDNEVGVRMDYLVNTNHGKQERGDKLTHTHTQNKSGVKCDDTKIKRYSVYVGKLPTSMNEVMLLQLFQKCGTIVDVYLAKTSENAVYKYGFVRFSSLESARRAVAVMNNYRLGSHELKVEMSSETRAVLQRVTTRPKLQPEQSRRYNQDEMMLMTKLKENFSKLQSEYDQFVKELKVPSPTGTQQDTCSKLVFDMAEIAEKLKEVRCGLSAAVGSEGKVIDIPEKTRQCTDTSDGPVKSKLTGGKKQETRQLAWSNRTFPTQQKYKRQLAQSDQAETGLKTLSTEKKVNAGRGEMIAKVLTSNEAKKVGHQINQGNTTPNTPCGRGDTQTVGRDESHGVGQRSRIPGLGRGALALVKNK